VRGGSTQTLLAGSRRCQVTPGAMSRLRTVAVGANFTSISFFLFIRSRISASLTQPSFKFSVCLLLRTQAVFRADTSTFLPSRKFTTENTLTTQSQCFSHRVIAHRISSLWCLFVPKKQQLSFFDQSFIVPPAQIHSCDPDRLARF